MKTLQIHRHILGFCLACIFCCAGSISASAAGMEIPSSSDERTENQPTLKNEDRKTLDTVSPGIPGEDSPILITEIQDEDKLLSLPDFILPLRSSSDDNNMEGIYQLAFRYRTVSATAAKNTESWQEILSVAWDFSSIDQTAAGEYAAVGRIELPQGYAFGSDVLRELKISVRVEAQAPAVITSIEKWHPYTDAFAFQQGSSMEELERSFSLSPYHLKCYAENGNSYTAVVEWDFSNIDLNTTGLYYALGKLNAPEDTVFADEILLPEISIPISVQAPGRPDINCLLVARGSLYFPWVMPKENLDKISVWLSENNGPWNRLEDEVYVSPDMLLLSTHRLIPGSSYRLQVDYDGGRTGILSFIYADELILEGYHEGDRDAGDAGGNPPSPIIQPPPEHTTAQEDSSADRPAAQPLKPPAENGEETDADSSLDERDTGSGKSGSPAEHASILTEEVPSPSSPLIPSKDERISAQDAITAPAENEESKAPAFSEFFDETTDRISGTRFLMMLQTGGQNAVFSKQGITVCIPESALPDGIQDEDQIEVIIQKEQDDRFSFSFSINGTALTSLPGVLVMLPYLTEALDTTWYLCDENGVKISMTSYDDTSKAASFQISHTGVYSITAKETDAASPAKDSSTENRQSPMLFLIPACLFFLPAGIVLLKRRGI